MTRGFGSEANPRDGDRVKIEVDLEGGVVTDARVTLAGCEVSTKAASAVARLVRRRGRSEALAVDLALVRTQIGPVDEEHEDCVVAAIGALRAAIVDAHLRATA